MEPDNESPIPTHDPKKTIKLTAIVAGLIVIIIIGLVLNMKPSKNGTQPSSQTKTAQVEITKDGFLPATLTVSKGTMVIWTNKDTAVHRVASNPYPEHTGLAGLDSKDVIGIEGGTYSFTFNTPGEYTYHDHLHPTTNGTIVVK